VADTSKKVVHTGLKKLNIPKSQYISIHDISEFIFCPRRAQYIRQENRIPIGKFIRQRWEYHNHETDNTLFECFKETCKYSFIYRLRRGTKTGWSGVRSALGIILSLRSKKGLDIPRDISPIVKLCQNYHKNYMNTIFAMPIHPNFPLITNIGRNPQGGGVVFMDILHAVGISEKGYVVIDFKMVPDAPANYNTDLFFEDPTILTRLWAFHECTGQKPYQYIVVYANPEKSSTVKTFTLYPQNSKLLIEGERNITYILRGCLQGINYPNRTEQNCASCPYKRKCYREKDNDFLHR